MFNCSEKLLLDSLSLDITTSMVQASECEYKNKIGVDRTPELVIAKYPRVILWKQARKIVQDEKSLK